MPDYNSIITKIKTELNNKIDSIVIPDYQDNIDEIKGRLDSYEEDIDEINDRLDDLPDYQDDIDEINTRLDSYEENLDEINGRIDNIVISDYDTQISNIYTSITNLNNTLSQQMVNYYNLSYKVNINISSINDI